MTTQHTDEMREAFENMARSCGCSVERTQYENIYKSDWATGAWWGYKAASHKHLLEMERLRKVIAEAVVGLSRVEGKQMGVWVNHTGEIGKGEYVTWNDGEYWVSCSTKLLRKALAAPLLKEKL